MSTVVITLKGAALQKLIKTFNSQQVASKNPYITFAAKVDKVMISVYTSGKVVFQGEKAEEVAKYFGYQAPDASIQTAPAGQKLALIGSDEVGNGTPPSHRKSGYGIFSTISNTQFSLHWSKVR